MTPVDNNTVENIAGKYLNLKNPQPQSHPAMNNILNNRKSIDRKNKSNSPNAKLSIKKPAPVTSSIKTMNKGKNLNRNE
jgi:hypothetical protein